jgi:hypothetical protein
MEDEEGVSDGDSSVATVYVANVTIAYYPLSAWLDWEQGSWSHEVVEPSVGNCLGSDSLMLVADQCGDDINPRVELPPLGQSRSVVCAAAGKVQWQGFTVR